MTDNSANNTPVVQKSNSPLLSLKEYRHKINAAFTSSSTLENEFYIDLSGFNTLILQELSALLFCKQYTKQRNGKLILTNVSAVLNDFFELTRTDRYFIY